MKKNLNKIFRKDVTYDNRFQGFTLSLEDAFKKKTQDEVKLTLKLFQG